jgi:hypothetical protein
MRKQKCCTYVKSMTQKTSLGKKRSLTVDFGSEKNI